ncbi:hypothetical protein LCGC14_1024050 [marine sediment metagenome]|uniref:Fumarate lyase N-terminal domain-containing protein n=1 Tax=marine sediment metagenome TaxID=412755 RepID=A0A0F9NI70_9ZZZZ
MGKDLYRSGIETPMSKKALNFISSLIEDLWIAEEDIIGSEVHNIMLFEQKILNKEEIKQILIALETIKEKLASNNLELDENFEDIHPFIEKSVIDQIGIEMGGKMHTGRSRNDQISVDLRLKIRKELNITSDKLFSLFGAIHTLSKNNISSYMPLYTHLQAGQLGVFSHYLNNYLSQILRLAENVEDIYKRINKNPLGSCAIGGTSININRDRTTELLGFDGLIYNSIDAISSRDYIYETLMVLSLGGIQFSRIAEDLMLWSTKEFGFIELDDKFCSVSSVMPQKKNPDTVELLRSRSSLVISNLFSAAMIIKAIPTGYSRDFQELKNLLRSSFDLIHSIIEMLEEIFSTIVVNTEKMRRNLEGSFILALDLAEILVQEYNIPFRQSHKIVALIVKNSESPDDMLNKEKIEEFIFKVENREIDISVKLIQDLKDFDSCLEKRKSQGSPAKKEIQLNIDRLIKNKDSLFKLFKKRTENIVRSKSLRETIIKDLTS